MLIHFVHIGDAYLPELQAYTEFVHSAGHQAQVHRHIDTLPGNAAVLWWLCGQVSRDWAQRYPAAFHVHEYASASVPPLAWLKDRIKRARQAVPQYRIYQNDWVRAHLGFADTLPCELRDMGISADFFDLPAVSEAPDFDFVYLGEMRRLQHFLPVLQALSQSGRRVLLIGELPEQLKHPLHRLAGLAVSGRIPHHEVPAQLRRARYGLNLVPDQLPYTRQTSTKLLEYCAAGLPVVSTSYPWVREFEQQHGARFAWLPFGASASASHKLLGSQLDAQRLVVPDVRALAWPRLLAGMNIWQHLGLHA